MAVMQPVQEPGQEPEAVAAPAPEHGPARTVVTDPPPWAAPRREPAGRLLSRPFVVIRLLAVAGLAVVVAAIGASAAGWDGPWLGLRALVGAGLALTLALTGLRAAGRDGPAPLPALLAWTPYAAAALLVLLPLALAGRMPLAAAVAAALLGVHLRWLAPRFRAEPAPRAAEGARLRVMVANVLVGGATAEAVAAAVRAERPDVLALVELTPALAAALDGTDVRKLLPFESLTPHPHPGGVGIYARRPLGSDGSLGGTNLPCRWAEVGLDGRRVGVLAVHAYPPRPGSTELWRGDLETVRAAAAGHAGPLLVVGDFNATADHAGFRALTDSRLRDAHQARGRGLVRTWPARGPLPPLLHLDHVLVSPDVAVLAVHERAIRGSDHLAVVADLALR
jgi:endonuclease/exonuclease/phosphatase (EEP) superfamily protein YafD